jgi:hypothetical protein
VPLNVAGHSPTAGDQQLHESGFPMDGACRHRLRAMSPSRSVGRSLAIVVALAAMGLADGCYLAATVSVHTKTWQDAKVAAPSVRIVHYR